MIYLVSLAPLLAILASAKQPRMSKVPLSPYSKVVYKAIMGPLRVPQKFDYYLFNQQMASSTIPWKKVQYAPLNAMYGVTKTMTIKNEQEDTPIVTTINEYYKSFTTYSKSTTHDSLNLQPPTASLTNIGRCKYFEPGHSVKTATSAKREAANNTDRRRFPFVVLRDISFKVPYNKSHIVTGNITMTATTTVSSIVKLYDKSKVSSYKLKSSSNLKYSPKFRPQSKNTNNKIHYNLHLNVARPYVPGKIPSKFLSWITST